MIGDPLTLEQLRKMDGQPVYLPQTNCWALVTKNPFVPLFTFPDGEQCNAVEWYKTVGPAYAYPPAHIDREAWGCEYCTGDVDDRPFLDSEDLYISGDGRLTSDGRDHDFCKIEFCPKCGRPLTEEAWAELEKRMGVRE